MSTSKRKKSARLVKAGRKFGYQGGIETMGQRWTFVNPLSFYGYLPTRGFVLGHLGGFTQIDQPLVHHRDVLL